MGGDGALNRLLTRYYAPLLAHLEYKFTLSREAAEDVLQDLTGHKVLEHVLGSFPRQREFEFEVGEQWSVIPEIGRAHV